MLTKTYYALLAATSALPNSKSSGQTFKDKDGNTRTLYTNSNFRQYEDMGVANLSSSIGAQNGWLVGDGTVPPTADDYYLSGNVITSITVLSSTYKVSLEGNSYKATRTFIVQNKGSSDITIGEIAHFAGVSYSTSSYCMAMMLRETLPTPLTLSPGASGQIDVTITFPF